MEEATNTVLKENTRPNVFGPLGVLITLITLTVFSFLFHSAVISRIGYCLAILCGILSFVQDAQDKNRGLQPNGKESFATVAIFLSLYLILTGFVG